MPKKCTQSSLPSLLFELRKIHFIFCSIFIDFCCNIISRLGEVHLFISVKNLVNVIKIAFSIMQCAKIMAKNHQSPASLCVKFSTNQKIRLTPQSQ